MRMAFGVLAEYVTVSHDGRLGIHGIFDGFTLGLISEDMPAAIPLHHIVIRLGFDAHEVGAFECALRLRDEDGKALITLGPFSQRCTLGRQPVPGFEIFHGWSSSLADLTVPRCGTYTWEVLVNAIKLGEIPFHVTKATQPTPAQATITQRPFG